MARLLITGASGFTGKYVVAAAVDAGFEVHGTVQQVSQSTALFTQHTVDLTDFSQVSRVVKKIQPDYVIHLAAISYVGHGDARDIYLVNVVGTINLLEALVRFSPSLRKVVVASSGNVYGNVGKLPILEDQPLAPENDYGVSKAAMEMSLALRMSKLPICVVRPFNYTGVGQAHHFLIPKIVAAFQGGEAYIELGNTDVSRDFSDVRDVAAAYLALLDADCVGETVNLCSGVATSLLDVIKTLETMSGREMLVKVNPEFVRSNEIKELFGSNAALMKLVGRYQRYELSDTLRWMLGTDG